MNDKVYVCLVETIELLGLMMTKGENGKYQIQGFESLDDGLRYFEDSYNRNHQRGYEASMSACINAITFRPSIVSLTLEEIKGLLTEPQSLVTARNASGSMTLLKLNDSAKAVYEAGAKPKIITDEVVAP